MKQFRGQQINDALHIEPSLRNGVKISVECSDYFLLFPPANSWAILMKMLMVSM